MLSKYYKYWQIWPIIAAIIIMILRVIVTPQFVETWYSCGVYIFFQWVFALLGKIVFFCSVNELLIAVCLGSYVFFIYKSYKRKEKFWRIGANTLAMFGVVYCAFNILWGFNYLRQPFYKHAAIDISVANKNHDYHKMAEMMVSTLNELQDCSFPATQLPDQIVDEAMHSTLEGIYKNAVTPPPTKYLLVNEFMNAAGISGIFLPFFMEPHINADLLPWERPFVMAHEKAHFHGFASETDANLIAYIACFSSKNKMLRYSVALRIFLWLSAYLEGEMWIQFFQKLNSNTQQHINAWQQRMDKNRKRYRTFYNLSRKVNDTYLKMNSQQLGILAYQAALPQFVRWYYQYNK
ncbi:DUF3810 family protein [Candidatus Uabimicrobium amorphum]|uniref:Zinc-binding protein n=1 Tax=Uabimicrobium amorphum TaxID=2596890 RepID=A0A5S9IJY4_UABAM|nr:DUF3810 family protein [Candidatus Uabimicrobium amorphum]BBM82846.1 zinc-binding protein [Candidatus Uabimicrobium amorphum]